MGWEKEYEHWRDMGHTWGPGVDDTYEFSEEELAEREARQQAFQEKLESYRVPARREYILAGKELEKITPDSKDIIYGRASFHWREKLSDAEITLCKKAAESLGYQLVPMDSSVKQAQSFAVIVKRYGWLPDRGGNIHPYAVSGIKNLEDCLQLVADFSAIGQNVTTYYDKDFHYSCNDTGELRYMLERRCEYLGLELPKTQKQPQSNPSLASQVQDASVKAEKIQQFSRSQPLKKPPDPEL